MSGSNWNISITGGGLPQEYALTIGATTTAPTKGTVVHDKAVFVRFGSLLVLQYTFEQSAVGVGGDGDYLFPLPPGLQIDTSKVVLATAGIGGTILGACHGKNAIRNNAGVVQAHDATNLKLLIPNGATTMKYVQGGAGAFLELGSAGITVYNFSVEIPIL
jgi:hypothetical protein